MLYGVSGCSVMLKTDMWPVVIGQVFNELCPLYPCEFMSAENEKSPVVLVNVLSTLHTKLNIT